MWMPIRYIGKRLPLSSIPLILTSWVCLLQYTHTIKVFGTNK